MSSLPVAAAPSPAPFRVMPRAKAAPPAQRTAVWIRRGTPEYRRAGIAMFLVGFATFALVHCVQPLLPAFAATFQVGPAESSLALSLTTGLLAFSIVAAGAFSQAVGRRGLIFGSMAVAALLDLAAAAAPGWHALLAARALEGLVLGGVPAVAMAWLSEEIDPAQLGSTMGLYIGGTAFGGMMGQVGMGVMSEVTSWRIALATLGVLCLAAAVGFGLLLPRSRNFERRPGLDLAFHLRTWGRHLRNPGLMRIYGVGFLLGGVFFAPFSYTTFRLSEAPWNLGTTAISLIFLVYALGSIASSLAGGMADRHGRSTLLVAAFVVMLAGIALTLPGSLFTIIGGIAVLTIGFFMGHAVASGAVGPLAGDGKGHAMALYMLAYYMGGSIMGPLAGWAWEHSGWPAVAALAASLSLVAIALSTRAGRA